MSEQDSEPCGSIGPHDPHTHGMFGTLSCPGVSRDTEYRVYANGIRRWTVLRDEVAPAFRRDFPGIIVMADERVIHLSYPDPDAWRGADIELLGLEYRLANSIVRALVGEFGLWNDSNYPDVRPLTDEEIERVKAHRG